MSPQIKLGNTYKAKIALGASCDYAEFTTKLNEKPYPVIDGSSTYSITPTKKGKQKFSSSIRFINHLTGESTKLEKDYFCEVY